MSTPEQQVRDILERMGYKDAQSLTAGDVVELANIIAENTQLKFRLSRMNASDVQVFNEDELAEKDRVIALLRSVAGELIDADPCVICGGNGKHLVGCELKEAIDGRALEAK